MKTKIEEVEKIDLKLQSAINLLVEKLTQAGVELEGKTIIIKDSKLTIK